MTHHYPNGTTYADLANMFTAEDFNADDFADIIKASGAKYFVLTSKHHEGFTMWPSATSWNWNAVDIGPHRDIVYELSQSIRGSKLHFGLYFSQYDWFHPLYLKDTKDNSTQFVQQVSYPQMLEIVQNYQPDVVWSDGDWEKNEDYWRSKDFLAWLYNDSPVKDKVVVNDRWGRGVMGVHGGFLTYQDHYDPGHLLRRKWENCMTLDKNSWGYRRDMKSEDVHTFGELVTELARTISCGGNLLLNIGPDHYGRIVPIFEERLRQMGQFVKVHDEAIFGTRPWVHQTDGPNVWYTSRVRSDKGLSDHRRYNPQDVWNTVVYAFILQIPDDGKITLASVKPTAKTTATLLGTTYAVPLSAVGSGGSVADISAVPWTKIPFREAIVLKIEYVANSEHNPLNDYRRLKGFEKGIGRKPTGSDQDLRDLVEMFALDE
jgi:alpha-L-fucosidase